MSKGSKHGRRAFLAMLPVALLAVGSARGWASVMVEGPPRQKRHPEPRRGIDASRVVKADALQGDADAIETFDMVREIPQVIDGLRCSCGCDEVEGFHSLLSCFETDGMARHCDVCRGNARLAHRLHRQGRTLREIRVAIDARGH